MASRVLFIMLALLSTSAPARAVLESDNTLAEQAKISMAEAITVAEQIIPGKPVQVQMGKDLGHTVYKVEIVGKDNKSRWVYVDAITGAITEAKRSSLPTVP
jgi:uncharacterized membrane protein YkoI